MRKQKSESASWLGYVSNAASRAVSYLNPFNNPLGLVYFLPMAAAQFTYFVPNSDDMIFTVDYDFSALSGSWEFIDSALKTCGVITTGFYIDQGENVLSESFGRTLFGQAHLIWHYNNDFANGVINSCARKIFETYATGTWMNMVDVFALTGIGFGALTAAGGTYFLASYCRNRFFPRNPNVLIDESSLLLENLGEGGDALPSERFDAMLLRLDQLKDSDNEVICKLVKDFTKVEEDFRCPITQCIMNEPVTLECLHSFEKSAVQLMQKTNPNACCPECRTSINQPPIANGVKKAEIENALNSLSSWLEALENNKQSDDLPPRYHIN